MSKKRILFLCTGNSCRSQMAEGLARHYRNAEIEPYSAGIETHGLNANAVKVMAEMGIDISNQQSQHIDEFSEINFDMVVTVCGHANENCPVFLGPTAVEHVGFEDPPALAKAIASRGGSALEQLDCYRRVRDEIAQFVQDYQF